MIAPLDLLRSLFLGLLVATSAIAAERPNVILVMADDQGYGDAGFTGHPTLRTPHLDAMAQTSLVLDRFHSSAPVCSPTRAAVLTGRHPFRGNVPNHGHYLRPEEVTLAEILRGAGYVTGHFGKWHIGSVQKESPTSPGGQGFDEWLSAPNFFDLDPFLSDNGDCARHEGQGSVVTMDAALRFIGEQKDGNYPFFAVIWFPAPHAPHRETPDDRADPVAADGRFAAYHREIQLVDQQVGRLRDELQSLGIEKDTLLWYCSDNGGLDPAHSGGRAKKGSIYQGGLRVPALVEMPGTIGPRHDATPSSTADILPTVLAVAGIEIPRDRPIDGASLKPLLDGGELEHPPIGFWSGHSGGQATHSDAIVGALAEAQANGRPTPHPERLLKNVRDFPDRHAGGLRGHAAWLDWPWKLHRIEQKGKVRFALYQLERDPDESRDLASRHPERVEAMRRDLEAWQESVLRSWEGKDYGNPGTKSPTAPNGSH